MEAARDDEHFKGARLDIGCSIKKTKFNELMLARK